MIGREYIVVVEMSDPGTSRHGASQVNGLQAADFPPLQVIPGISGPARKIMEPHAGISGLRDEPFSLVRAMIADNDDLNIRIGLAEHRGQGLVDKQSRAIVGGYRDAYERLLLMRVAALHLIPAFGQQRRILLGDGFKVAFPYESPVGPVRPNRRPQAGSYAALIEGGQLEGVQRQSRASLLPQ